MVLAGWSYCLQSVGINKKVPLNDSIENYSMAWHNAVSISLSGPTFWLLTTELSQVGSVRIKTQDHRSIETTNKGENVEISEKKNMTRITNKPQNNLKACVAIGSRFVCNVISDKMAEDPVVGKTVIRSKTYAGFRNFKFENRLLIMHVCCCHVPNKER